MPRLKCLIRKFVETEKMREPSMVQVFTRSDGTDLEILYPPYCEICGNPIPISFADTHPYCAACRNAPDKSNPIVKVRAFGKYFYENEFPKDILSKEIRELKCSSTNGELLLECLYFSMEEQYPELMGMDVVVPVMRGSQDGEYNQSAFLASGIAARYGKPDLDILFKTQTCRPMHSIHNHCEKEKEIAGKIGCSQRIDGLSVLLVDDTCIDTVTKRECARVLRANGASDVRALVLGRMVNQEHLAALRKYK